MDRFKHYYYLFFYLFVSAGGFVNYKGSRALTVGVSRFLQRNYEVIETDNRHLANKPIIKNAFKL